MLYSITEVGALTENFEQARIANLLNARYPNPGKIWTPQTVNTILRNPLYTGRMRFSDVLTKEPLEHLRIVSDGLFEFAARVLQEHIPKKYVLDKNGSFQEIDEQSEAGSSKTSVYGASLLSGILHCAHCDHKLVGTYHTKINASGARVYRPVYRCYNGAVQAKNCTGQRTYSAAKIEEAVLSTIRQSFSTFSKTIDALWREQVKAQLQRKQSANLRQTQAELSRLQARQAKLKEEAIRALTGESAYSPDIVQELLSSNAEALMKAETEIQGMLSEKSELDAKLREMTEQYRNIRDWAEVFDTASADEKKMILARIIRKITVDRNYAITIYFFLTLDDFKRAFEDDHPEMVEIVEAANPRRVLA